MRSRNSGSGGCRRGVVKLFSLILLCSLCGCYADPIENNAHPIILGLDRQNLLYAETALYQMPKASETEYSVITTNDETPGGARFKKDAFYYYRADYELLSCIVLGSELMETDCRPSVQALARETLPSAKILLLCTLNTSAAELIKSTEPKNAATTLTQLPFFAGEKNLMAQCALSELNESINDGYTVMIPAAVYENDNKEYRIKGSVAVYEGRTVLELTEEETALWACMFYSNWNGGLTAATDELFYSAYCSGASEKKHKDGYIITVEAEGSIDSLSKPVNPDYCLYEHMSNQLTTRAQQLLDKAYSRGCDILRLDTLKDAEYWQTQNVTCSFKIEKKKEAVG